MLCPNATTRMSRSYQISATTMTTTMQMIFCTAVSCSSVLRSRLRSWLLGCCVRESGFIQSILTMQSRQSLELRQHQQLALTPQLQQSIRFLQLSTHELEQEVAQARSEEHTSELQSLM